MRHLPYVLLALAMLTSACFSAESYARKDFERDYRCSGDEVKVTDAWQGRGSNDKLFPKGCDRRIVYLCNDGHERCVRPDKIVRARHARQFGCEASDVDADYLDGNSWRVSGCGSTATYVCDNSVIDMSCVMETSGGRSRRHRD